MKVKRKINSILLLALILLSAFIVPSLAVDNTALPVITVNAPADTGVVNSANTTISFSVSDNEPIQNGNYYIKLNGVDVASTLQYRVYVVDDPATETSYNETDYTQATISAAVTGLKDGVHTVDVQAMDQSGNKATKTWTFTISSKPAFSEPSPGNGTNTTNNHSFSVKVSDNDGIDQGSIGVSMDNNTVPFTFDAASGLITAKPAEVITNGTHTANVSLTDTAGHTATYAWSFTVQNGGPTLTFNNDGQIFDVFNPTFKVNINSNIKLDDKNIIMNINGQQVPAAFAFPTTTVYVEDSWGGYVPTEQISDYTRGILSYTAPSLKDGEYTLSVTAKDILGNSSTQAWKFAVAQKPLFSTNTPGDGAIVDTQTPAINVTITDPNNPTIDTSSVKLLIDDSPVVPTITISQGSIVVSYKPSPLANDKYHSVSLTALDPSGNSSTLNWKFYVNTRGEMLLSSPGCKLCHQVNQYGKYVHTQQSSDCGHCHGEDQQKCQYCHAGVNSPEPQMECTYCHSKDMRYAIAPEGTGLHQNLPPHQSDQGSCNSCHSIYLPREHNRKDKNAVQITCGTCHNSTEPDVQQAIETKNTNCSACHDKADHETIHKSSLDAKCQTCHSSILSREHSDNPTTSGQNLTCDSCHKSTDNTVKRTIAAGKLNCSGCHEQAHKVDLADQVPSDIPLYTGFRYTQPLEAALFANDPSAPPGFDTGQVILTDRLTVSLNDVWSFYQTQLTQNGWAVVSGAPAEAAKYFAAEFQKNGRTAFLRFSNTALGDGSGPELAGYRLEIWYK